NGSPFASRGAGGLSRLSVKLIKAGVTPERIAPGKPQQNGRHERMHLTLLQEVASPPASSMRDQLKRLRNFQQLYNEERPHQALDNATPAERYQASPRRFDGNLRSPEYGDQDVRRVRHNGEIKFDGKFIYISDALAGEPVGLAESEGYWTVSYGPIILGTIANRADQLRKPKRAVDLGTTLRVAPRVHSTTSNRPERTENCVTHVVGLNCYLCRRLLNCAWRCEASSSAIRVRGRSSQQRPLPLTRIASFRCDPTSPYGRGVLSFWLAPVRPKLLVLQGGNQSRRIRPKESTPESKTSG